MYGLLSSSQDIIIYWELNLSKFDFFFFLIFFKEEHLKEFQMEDKW